MFKEFLEAKFRFVVLSSKGLRLLLRDMLLSSSKMELQDKDPRKERFRFFVFLRLGPVRSGSSANMPEITSQ